MPTITGCSCLEIDSKKRFAIRQRRERLPMVTLRLQHRSPVGDERKKDCLCFRPSALTQDDSNVKTGTCPTCGMPVAAESSVTAGVCPYCGDPIPAAPPEDSGDLDSPGNVRIL